MIIHFFWGVSSNDQQVYEKIHLPLVDFYLQISKRTTHVEITYD